MGREIRRVPANWEHPTKEHYDPFQRRTKIVKQPMYDEEFATAATNWKAELAKWESGERPNYFDAADYPAGLEYWEWETNPPERAYYRPWKDEEATWFQVWETVSEGTPVTPPFATAAELIDYLVENGDEWDQKRGHGGWLRGQAEGFVGRGWAPSMVVTRTAAETTIYEPRDGLPA